MASRGKGQKKGTRTSRFGTSARISHDASTFYASRMNEGTDVGGGEEVLPENPFPAQWTNRIIHASAEEMKEIPERSVHLMVTSPPYNASKAYDADLSMAEYLRLLRSVFAETWRVLVDGGRACVNIANLGRKPYIPLSHHVARIMSQIGFRMRGEIIWNKGAGAGVSMAWGSWQAATNPVLRDVHEYILVFCKGPFRRAQPGGESTISREQFMAWTKSVWEMTPASARKVGHPAPFPVELPYRLIQLYTFKGDVVLDPFIGSGTSALAALGSGRRFIGYESDADYVRLAEERIAAYGLQDRPG